MTIDLIAAINLVMSLVVGVKGLDTTLVTSQELISLI